MTAEEIIARAILKASRPDADLDTFSFPEVPRAQARAALAALAAGGFAVVKRYRVGEIHPVPNDVLYAAWEKMLTENEKHGHAETMMAVYNLLVSEMDAATPPPAAGG